jgi:dGTPase
MNWNQLLNKQRLGGRAAKEESGRNAFLRDHDKIIFSGAFRRLARKTQVHPLASNDHIHNRLTHSLEVSCVGRTLGIRVGQALALRGLLPAGIEATNLGDIVQSACLAHDIGNPPFGHTGERAIRA